MNIADINPLALPSLPLSDRFKLPNLPAIYFVISGEQIIYIGQTTSLTRRFLSHHKLKEFIGASPEPCVAWLECNDLSLLKQIEYALIKHFAPTSNTLIKATERSYISYPGEYYDDAWTVEAALKGRTKTTEGSSLLCAKLQERESRRNQMVQYLAEKRNISFQ
jgi:predicted GIY-YIG superfamily endonuclease